MVIMAKRFVSEEARKRKNEKAAKRYKEDEGHRRSRSDYHKRLREKKKQDDPAFQEKEANRVRLWRENNEEKARGIAIKSKEKHKEKRMQETRKWFAENKDKRAAYQTKRRSTEKNRTPLWADASLINHFYFMAKFFTLISGTKYVVDHIIPLQGKNVSGLHSQHNLQVITAKSNNIKYNKMDSDPIILMEAPEFTESQFLGFMYQDVSDKNLNAAAAELGVKVPVSKRQAQELGFADS